MGVHVYMDKVIKIINSLKWLLGVLFRNAQTLYHGHQNQNCHLSSMENNQWSSCLLTTHGKDVTLTQPSMSVLIFPLPLCICFQMFSARSKYNL